jgi:hypothetical protein
MAQAGMVCERGKITVLKHASGGRSQIYVAADKSPASPPKEWVQGQKATVISYQADDIRWRDRFSLLRTAFALQLPIEIVANDGSDCIGLTDEFAISICQGDGGC